jgi:drug/metabolite transporter (DMT)-like permease
MALLVQSSGRRAIVLEVQMPTIQTSMRSATKTTSPAGLGHPVRLPPRHSAIIASMMANRWLPLVVWSGLCFIWGSTWLAIKVGLNDLPPLTFAGIRFVIAAVMLFAIILIRRIRLPATAADWRILAWTGFLNITVNYALVFWGEQYLASGLAALLNATVPLFGLPLAHRYIASERLTARRISGVLLGLAGVAIVCSAELGGNGTHAFWASVAIIVASLAGAQGSVLVKAKGGHFDPALLAGVQMATGCIPLLLGGILLEGNPVEYHWTMRAFVALAYLAVVGSVVAFLAYYWLIRHIEVTSVLLIPLVTPLVAVLLGVTLLGEKIGWGTAAGGSAILVGVALVVFAGTARTGISRAQT